MKSINKILNQQIGLIKPGAEVLKVIEKTASGFCTDLKKKLNKKKIKADVFIGGSLAKATLTKKKKYDIDIFVRFDQKYQNSEISKLLGSILGKARKIHGSRDYYQVIVNEILIEIIPVMKIKKPEQAENITDLSYFHVNYLKKKIKKKKKLSDEILLAKTFTYAQNCYGAESYINGFSGYALELLICDYGSFLKFIKEISSISDKNIKRKKKSLSFTNKIIIDSEKLYKNADEILRELNKSKLNSPIILIDPTFKDRNALAGLSKQTFEKFKKVCRAFLKNPGSSFFEKKDVLQELSRKYGKDLIKISVKTNKQAGDIAGTKSKKFFKFFCRELGKEFNIKKQEFDYDEKQNIAYFYFVLSKKKDEIIKGPPIVQVHNLTKFKKAHPKSFIKKHVAYAKIKHEVDFGQFLKFFKKKYKKTIISIGVESFQKVQ